MTVIEVGARPFYHEFAWAYDALIPRPVADECAGIAAGLARRGVRPGAAVLDAGAGPAATRSSWRGAVSR